ncbi:MAG: sulfatase-like hydrolase/transferase [Acidobacteriota bacterium]
MAVAELLNVTMHTHVTTQRARQFWLFCGGTLIAFGLLGCASVPSSPERAGSDTAAASQRPPNIVVVLSDDQRYDTLGMNGHPFIETPNIDRLARQGVRFDNSFVITSLCQPSRATLLTGRYTHRTQVTANRGANRNPEASMVVRLRQAGYRTGFFGKYHLEDCTPRPEFDHWECLAGRLGQGTYVEGKINVNGVKQPYEGYSTDTVTERANAWIASQQDRPFFALISVKNPHVPLTPPPRHAELYADAEIALPASADDPKEGLPAYVRAEMIAPALAQELEAQADTAAASDAAIGVLRSYARMIPSIDDVVGRVDAGLEAAGLRDHTLLVFTSDNGILLGEHGIFRKKLAYEPSIRVPLVMRLPGRIPAGSRPPQMVLNVDLAATFLDAAGVEPEPELELDGRSLLELLDNPRARWRESWVYIAPYRRRSQPPFLALRTERWKYVRYAGSPIEEQLFDLQSDPAERQNLAAAPASQRQLERMRRQLRQGARELELPPSWYPTERRAGSS